MGTLDSTKHKGWTWILQAPVAEVMQAGVHFDPNARGVKASQGDAASGSALEVGLCTIYKIISMTIDVDSVGISNKSGQ